MLALSKTSRALSWFGDTIERKVYDKQYSRAGEFNPKLEKKNNNDLEMLIPSEQWTNAIHLSFLFLLVK